DDGIFLVDESELNNWKNSERVIVTKNYSNAYEEASEKSDKVSDLVLGDILKFVESKNNFTKIEFPDSRIAFIKSSDVKSYNTWSGDSIATNERIVNSAKEFLGLPYLWGGTSSKGVDCSGFTKTVYFMNGVILPRDASQQVNVGELVDTKDNFSNLVPGDLLFFGRKKSDTEKEKVTHVALYIGDGNYIHSSGRLDIIALIKMLQILINIDLTLLLEQRE
ncbi:MAG: C40 family peptidase, partial [Ignavibacteriae bacterium]|nr:C40 family peptidase [Ignavibacteriota bacterium]